MRKKIILIILVVLALTPLMAANSFSFDNILNNEKNWGIGLNLGTSAGVIVELNNKDYDFYLNFGFDVYSSGFSGAVGVDYKITEFNIEKAKFDVGIGGEVPVIFTSEIIIIKGLFTGSVSYQFEEIPLKTYIRLGLGAKINIYKGILEPSFGGGIGVIYQFE